jgi:hypothetical protein
MFPPRRPVQANLMYDSIYIYITERTVRGVEVWMSFLPSSFFFVFPTSTCAAANSVMLQPSHSSTLQNPTDFPVVSAAALQYTACKMLIAASAGVRAGRECGR